MCYKLTGFAVKRLQEFDAHFYVALCWRPEDFGIRRVTWFAWETIIWCVIVVVEFINTEEKRMSSSVFLLWLPSSFSFCSAGRGYEAVYNIQRKNITVSRNTHVLVKHSCCSVKRVKLSQAFVELCCQLVCVHWLWHNWHIPSCSLPDMGVQISCRRRPSEAWFKWLWPSQTFCHLHAALKILRASGHKGIKCWMRNQRKSCYVVLAGGICSCIVHSCSFNFYLPLHF